MPLSWLPGQESNSENLRMEHKDRGEAMQPGQNGVRRQALNQTEGVDALACRRADFVYPLEWVEPTVGNTSFIAISMLFAYF